MYLVPDEVVMVSSVLSMVLVQCEEFLTPALGTRYHFMLVTFIEALAHVQRVVLKLRLSLRAIATLPLKCKVNIKLWGKFSRDTGST